MSLHLSTKQSHIFVRILNNVRFPLEFIESTVRNPNILQGMVSKLQNKIIIQNKIRGQHQKIFKEQKYKDVQNRFGN